ncbi:AMP-binding protein [Nocardia sp. NPDC051756]|uniref:AMP-binding protein n=1 Tax=Nocardia sp. NPDC051756 TaxID=3154751 RepID=UPI00342665EA
MSEDDPGEFVRAMMRWHFSAETGSPFWLARAKTLDFDPLADVRSFEDLALFPNVVDELRDIAVRDLIPRGYEGPVRVYESGGTTGQPKRVVFTADWERTAAEWLGARFDAIGVPRDADWLSAIPSGPHGVGATIAGLCHERGGLNFTIDLDPRWVKRLIADGRGGEADAYTDHLIEQIGYILRSQEVGVLVSTPPLLERLARRDDLVELVNRKVRTIIWGGAHLDADTRDLLRREVFPQTELVGMYGSTMVLGAAIERPGLSDEDSCVFDTFAPYTTFRIVDPETGNVVPYGERGQVVMNHLSKTALLVNNTERDHGVRMASPTAGFGDSVADVAPVAAFGGAAVIEGVY